MVIDKTVVTKWNSKTKKYYENLGYIYTFMGDSFEIRIEDLPKNSSLKINIECDYCHKPYLVRYAEMNQHNEDSPIKKDSCSHCKYLKAQECLLLLYRVDRVMYKQEFVDNNKKAVFEKYGVENVFQLESVKDKIIEHNMELYGVESYSQTQECKDKKVETNLIRYGETSHMKTEKYKKMFTGENSPVWKGGKINIRWERLCKKYRIWRDSIFNKNNYICQKCNEHSRQLEAHHILNWHNFPDLRYDFDNGITFCKKCHSLFHKRFTRFNNNAEQLFEFLQ